MGNETAQKILEAARARLLADGYAALSTRSVAEAANVPLSQIHYHFGSKEELILRLLRAENDRVLGRQTAMFARNLPLWKRWDLACDYFDEDMASGYVRVLNEMTAAGWSSEPVRKEVKEIYLEWADLLRQVAEEAKTRGVSLGNFEPADVSALVSAWFIGAEALMLLDMESDQAPYRRALRKVGDLIRTAEEAAA